VNIFGQQSRRINNDYKYEYTLLDGLEYKLPEIENGVGSPFRRISGN
jgi:hypothetical protein